MEGWAWNEIWQSWEPFLTGSSCSFKTRSPTGVLQEISALVRCSLGASPKLSYSKRIKQRQIKSIRVKASGGSKLGIRLSVCSRGALPASDQTRIWIPAPSLIDHMTLDESFDLTVPQISSSIKQWWQHPSHRAVLRINLVNMSQVLQQCLALSTI